MKILDNVTIILFNTQPNEVKIDLGRILYGTFQENRNNAIHYFFCN